MKSYTDIEQSKKLTEILPLESADMYYQYVRPKSDKIRYNPILGNPIDALEWYNKGYTHFGKNPLTLNEYCIPCWSLAVLSYIIRKKIGYVIYGINNVYISCSYADFKKIETDVYDNEIDACYEMILRLHELKQL